MRMHVYVFFDGTDTPSSFYDVGVEEFAQICQTFIPPGNATVVVANMGKYASDVYEEERREVMKIAAVWGERVVFKIGYTVVDEEKRKRYEEILMREYEDIMTLEEGSE